MRLQHFHRNYAVDDANMPNLACPAFSWDRRKQNVTRRRAAGLVAVRGMHAESI